VAPARPKALPLLNSGFFRGIPLRSLSSSFIKSLCRFLVPTRAPACDEKLVLTLRAVRTAHARCRLRGQHLACLRDGVAGWRVLRARRKNAPAEIRPKVPRREISIGPGSSVFSGTTAPCLQSRNLKKSHVGFEILGPLQLFCSSNGRPSGVGFEIRRRGLTLREGAWGRRCA